MNRIGILGGTFDPIHLGHLVPAQYAFEYLHLDRLILVPSATPVHRPRHAPASGDHRLRMCQLAAASLPGFEVSDIEIRRPEPSYTVLTLQQFAQVFGPATTLILLVGEDNLPILHTWHQVKEIFSLALVAVLPRPLPDHYDLGPLQAAIGRDAVAKLLAARIPAPLVPISATQIRQLVAAHQPITHLVPATVADHIAANQLYAASSPDTE